MSRWRDQDDNHNPIGIGRVITSGGNQRAIVATLFLTIPEPTAFDPRIREPPLLIKDLIILIARLQYPERARRDSDRQSPTGWQISRQYPCAPLLRGRVTADRFQLSNWLNFRVSSRESGGQTTAPVVYYPGPQACGNVWALRLLSRSPDSPERAGRSAAIPVPRPPGPRIIRARRLLSRCPGQFPRTDLPDPSAVCCCCCCGRQPRQLPQCPWNSGINPPPRLS